MLDNSCKLPTPDFYIQGKKVEQLLVLYNLATLGKYLLRIALICIIIKWILALSAGEC